MENANTNKTQLDELLSCLANETRRRIIVALRAADSSERVDEQSLLTRATEQSAIELQHVHLPMLDDVGLVEWEPDHDVVARGPYFDDAVRLLEALESTEME